jgi:hypothetical protein
MGRVCKWTAVLLLSTACESHDGDQDGFLDALGDSDEDACEDADSIVEPPAPDEAGDGIDQNCDGTDGVDADQDGHSSFASGGDDCDDADAYSRPDVVEVGRVGWTIVGNGISRGGCPAGALGVASSTPRGAPDF